MARWVVAAAPTCAHSGCYISRPGADIQDTTSTTAARRMSAEAPPLGQLERREQRAGTHLGTT